MAELDFAETLEEAAEAVARGAEGGLRDAESMLDQLVAFCGDKITEQDVTGTWADLPFGKRSSAGTLTLRLDGGAYGATSFNRVGATGDLSSAGWLYTCNDAFVAPARP